MRDEVGHDVAQLIRVSVHVSVHTSAKVEQVICQLAVYLSDDVEPIQTLWRR